MADLKKLFAKKESDAPADAGTNARPIQSERVEGTAATPQATTPKPANPFSRRSSGGQNDSGGQSSGGTPAGSQDAGSSSEPKPGLSSLRIGSRTRDSSVDTGGVDGASIDSLESLNATTDEGNAPRTGVSYFSDETPATKPTRELPEGLSSEQLGFVELLDSVYDIMHDPDLLGGVVKNIMVELKSNAEYTKLMSPEDIRAMVRGMRESMGLARVKKQESKKGGRGGKKSKALDIDMLADLDALGIEV